MIVRVHATDTTGDNEAEMNRAARGERPPRRADGRGAAIVAVGAAVALAATLVLGDSVGAVAGTDRERPGLVATARFVPPPPPTGLDPNPCLDRRKRRQLYCPDLVMKRPFGLYVDTWTKPGRLLLRAGNSIDNIGSGPAELHGVRRKASWMVAWQRIYRRGGGRIRVRTRAYLYFKRAHLGLRWWKVWRAARFELWRLDRRGRAIARVRVGPKVSYCFRDLRRTRPWVRRSPPAPVYPACSTDASAQRVTLGTSPGWSDIYPPTYHEQWIDVTGLRGCFAYVHIADPANSVYESNERNNRAAVVVRLPYRPGPQGCPGAKLPAPEGPAAPEVPPPAQPGDGGGDGSGSGGAY
ncbi:hypothetical protein JDY09_05815 [Thermoleophilum album]|uniref:hypothetical protein n=1 Tax=Thermoleophilum album TaxID=29539 RepID=UPI00237C6F60|nr:hypothetical protein [Thermoleophilum album]WDT92915.1 hypothetical protein JDY09_05815 [Thermoleophilum album]